MKSILIVDCYLDATGSAQNWLDLAPLVDSGAELRVIRAAHGGLEDWLKAAADPAGDPAEVSTQESLERCLDDVSTVIVGGSAASVGDERDWIAKLEQLTRCALRLEKPVLGVCFGHQLLAQAWLGASRVRLKGVGELGWIDVRQGEWEASDHSECELLSGFGESFRCFASHSDEVLADSSGLRVLASSATGEVQAMHLKGTRGYGVQFHPEIGLEEARLLFEERKGQDPERGQSQAVFDQAGQQIDAATLKDRMERLLRNFLAIADESNASQTASEQEVARS